MNAQMNRVHSIYLYKKANLSGAFKSFVSWLFNSAIGVSIGFIQKHDMVEQKLNKKTLQLTLISCIGVIIVS